MTTVQTLVALGIGICLWQIGVLLVLIIGQWWYDLSDDDMDNL